MVRASGRTFPRRCSGPYVLLFSIFVVASCAIVYELLISTAASYLQGDTILQFSVTIGLFLTAMGGGSWCSRAITAGLIRSFVLIELLVGLIGGLSVPILFFVYGSAFSEFPPVMYASIAVIGGLIGLEVPLVTRILAGDGQLGANLANVLSFDYLGGLLGSLAFPLLLLPHLGMVRTSLLVGTLNLLVAAATALVYRRQMAGNRLTAITLAGALLTLLVLFAASDPLSAGLEQRLYRYPIILSTQTPYQELVVTKWHDDVRLFIDGHLQFSSRDEYRYHETLVHPAMMAVAHHQSILIVGGGDGLAAREILKYPDVESITLVDLDPGMTNLFAQQPLLADLNDHAYASPKLHTVNADGFQYLQQSSSRFDLIVADLPDPRSEALQKLYTREFYTLVRAHLAPGGAFVTQATSPFFTAQAFWCIVATARTVWPAVVPYHVDVPSFGSWGFVLAGEAPVPLSDYHVAVPTRFLTDALLPGLFAFGKDVLQQEAGVSVNTLLRPVLPGYYEQGWSQFQS
jgi:spermidine synthase